MLLKKMFVGMLAAFMLASCSNDEFVGNEAANVQNEKCTLRFKVKPFVVNDYAETRAFMTGVGNNKQFGVDFESGDRFGVCALDGSFNAPYSCSSIVDEVSINDAMIKFFTVISTNTTKLSTITNLCVPNNGMSIIIPNFARDNQSAITKKLKNL